MRLSSMASEHVVAGVVVLFADFEGATLGLQVEQLVAQMLGDQLDARDTHGGRSRSARRRRVNSSSSASQSHSPSM